MCYGASDTALGYAAAARLAGVRLVSAHCVNGC
jgi:hypothetical protein